MIGGSTIRDSFFKKNIIYDIVAKIDRYSLSITIEIWLK